VAGVTGTKITGDGAGVAGAAGITSLAGAVGRHQPSSDAAVTPTAIVVEATAAVSATARRRVGGGSEGIGISPGDEVVRETARQAHGEQRGHERTNERLLHRCSVDACRAIARLCDAHDHEDLRVMTHTDGGRGLASNVAFATASVVMTALIAIDLATDVWSGTAAFHVVVEGAMIAIGVVAAVRLAMRVRELTREARELREHARELTANLDASRQDAAR
jgi:hypothetical protein